MKVQGKKTLSVQVPAPLYDMLAKIAIDRNTSITAIIIQYLQYLKELDRHARKPLNAKSSRDFEPDDRKSSAFY